LVRILLSDVDFDRCQMRINQGKGKKDRIVPFPEDFKEILMMHAQSIAQKGGKYLFESSWKRSYSDRGVRKILAIYSKAAGMKHTISPHKLRHFLFTWLKKQGIEDALIQPYSGHESRQSLEIYSKLSIGDAQGSYEKVIGKFPV
jgi:integrase/recombinase XerD